MGPTMQSKQISKLIDATCAIHICLQRMQTDRTGHFLRQVLIISLLCLTFGAPVMAGSIQLPAIVEPASSEQHIGKLIFVELMTPDLAAAKKFYEGLFGWTFLDIHTGGIEYAAAFLDGRSVAGLIQKKLSARGNRQSAWLSFFAVRDVDAAKKDILKNGARVLVEPHNIPDRGRVAIFSDPQGAVFAVLASSSGDPADALAAPGEWIWISLVTTEPDSAAAFYQMLFNYEVFDLPASEGAKHLLLASDKYARASVNSLSENRSNTRPHWLNYIRVTDAVKMTERVVALGGRVLVEPRVDRHGGKVAVVADPFGAPFGLLEWTASDTKEVTQ